MAAEPVDWIRTAAQVYTSCVKAVEREGQSLDLALSAALKKIALDAPVKAKVVDLAQALLRWRRRLEAASIRLPFAPTREALACMALLARDPQAPLPIAAAGRAILTAAWAATSVEDAFPAWFVDVVTTERGDHAVPLLAALLEAPPPTLRANTGKTTRDGLIEALGREGLAARPTRLSPTGVVLDARANVFRTTAFHDGLFEVQDEGSQLVSLLVGARPGQTVIDGCAGAGGKTLHLACAMEGRGSLHAWDVSARRLDALRERCVRADVHNVRVRRLDGRPTEVRAGDAGLVDAILVDAPCSGTGVVRRNPDTLWRLEAADVERMADQQRQILDGYAPLVRPGGRLVYATCSLLAAENERQVEAFLARWPSFRVMDAEQALAEAGVPVAELSRGGCLSVDPARHGTDGFFAAVLVRR
jgi:16S rRNA (cytosine967-C5)-methyltransferase